MEIELYLFERILPINGLAILNRMMQILSEAGTNTPFALKDIHKSRFQACLLILYEISRFESWDVVREWKRVKQELRPLYVAKQFNNH